jgi:hypothetical protein
MTLVKFMGCDVAVKVHKCFHWGLRCRADVSWNWIGQRGRCCNVISWLEFTTVTAMRQWAAFWFAVNCSSLGDVTPCCLVEIYRSLRGACCLHYQALLIEAVSTSETSLVSTGLHGETSCKTASYSTPWKPEHSPVLSCHCVEFDPVFSGWTQISLLYTWLSCTCLVVLERKTLISTTMLIQF